jgi:hypothetical protein
MLDTANETEALITTIRTRSEGEEDAAQAIHLIRLIPCAGGVIASIITENASRRRTEKVCDVLSDLNAKLEQHGTDPEQHLSKDQIIEVVHETLQTAATASDERKIEALKAGLGYAFLADDTFERKQLFLQTLRGCTSIELMTLPVLYDANDPYLVREGYENTTGSDWISLGRTSLTDHLSFADSPGFMPKGNWIPTANREECGQASLLAFLSSQIGVDEGATEGAVRLLDGKGLATAGPSLSRRDCKILQWRVSVDSYRMPSFTVSATGTVPSLKVKPSPLEASRTKFGEGFLRFCRNL